MSPIMGLLPADRRNRSDRGYAAIVTTPPDEPVGYTEIRALPLLRPETLDGLPINHFAAHVDFMIGGPDPTLTWIGRGGTRRLILDGE